MAHMKLEDECIIYSIIQFFAPNNVGMLKITIHAIITSHKHTHTHTVIKQKRAARY